LAGVRQCSAGLKLFALLYKDHLDADVDDLDADVDDLDAGVDDLDAGVDDLDADVDDWMLTWMLGCGRG